MLEQSASSGLIRLWRRLLPLKSVVTFLQTGAHPDDETTRLLARLRSEGLRLAYACATRGQGGQNAVGTEAGSDLGLLRTAEMEAAAGILDLDLYWLGIDEDDSITDFGFSKSGEDTLGRWGDERLLERLVRVIRTVRPDILCPTFLDVGGQHGHHRAITRTTEAAFHKAADPDAFPEHRALGLQPWAVAKLYLPAFGGGGGSYDDEEPPPPATLSLDIGTIDPMFGATPAQIGEWSRVRHLSQGMGHWIPPEPAAADLHLKASRLGTPGREASILDGLPRTLADIAESPASPLHEAQAAIEEAIAAFPHRAPVAEALARAHRLLSGAKAAPEHAHRIERTMRHVEQALAEALLVTPDLTVTPTRLAPDESAEATLTLAFGAIEPEVGEAAIEAPEGWSVEAAAGPAEHAWRFRITARDAPAFTSPYRFDHDPRRGLGAVAARVRLTFAGAAFTVPVATREPVVLAPALSVKPRPDRIAWRIGAHGAGLPVGIAVENGGAERRDIRVGLGVPVGWSVSASASGSAGDLRLVPPAHLEPGRFEVPVLVDGAPAWTATRIAYDHIRPIQVARPALIRVCAMRVELPEGHRVAHVAGGSDRAADDLRQIGLAIEDLSDAELRAGDFARFDTILVGVFALRARPALTAVLPALKSWIEAGGNLVTLYHRPWDSWDPEQTPPAPLAIGQPSLRWRVTNPAAPVTVLAPDHPLLARPNRIGAEDWEGWVKERGLYFASRWDPAYQPLVSLADPGEEPHRGALLAGRFGRGQHVHVSLALHTQLAALVPGAYRLMANLLAKPS